MIKPARLNYMLHALIVLSIVAVIVLAVALQTMFFMWAWNLIIAGLLHWAPEIHFMQALAITFLLDVLFNGLAFITGGFFAKTK